MELNMKALLTFCHLGQTHHGDFPAYHSRHHLSESAWNAMAERSGAVVSGGGRGKEGWGYGGAWSPSLGPVAEEKGSGRSDRRRCRGDYEGDRRPYRPSSPWNLCPSA